MRYFFCLFLPPLAVLSTGRIGAFILNLFLCALFVLPGIIHAFLVVNRMYADRRHRESLKAMGKQQVIQNTSLTLNQRGME